MGLREDHKELTRRTVLGAVIDLLADGSLDELSVPAVSRRSGVSLATIYRYFPSKDDLLAAAAEEPSRQALAAEHPRRADDDDLAGYQRAMWHGFVHNLPLLRHQITSEAGRDMRVARLDRSRRQLADYIRRDGIDPASPEGQRLISMLLLVGGSLALVELHDRQGLDVDDAIDVSLWAARALITSTRQSSIDGSREQALT
jgi:AcrR family transcriptional regulator